MKLEDQVAIALIAVIDQTPMSFDAFIDGYPDSENRYKLRLGVAIEMG